MKLLRFNSLWTFVAITFTLALLLGCMPEKRISMGDKQLFEAIAAGMSRSEVERLLGKPVVDVDNEVYYGKPPKIEIWQSPPAPASILVVYSSNNVVQSKKFFGGSN